MLQRSTIQLLRFHFSCFLLPVFLFALSQAHRIDPLHTTLAFIILHFLVYPSSNGYNSYMDRDTTPIGGLKNPLQPTKQLYAVTIILDSIAALLSLFVSWQFALGILLYIIASRAYSYRGIRLKQYPLVGFATVFIFQGALVFCISYLAITGVSELRVPLLPCIISSFLIGALYPLTQIYQHETDLNDGVQSISYIVGKRGTFVFSMTLFVAATILLYVYFGPDRVQLWLGFLLIMLPVVLFLMLRMIEVWRNADHANLANSFRMNVLATLCTSIYFIFLILYR